MNLFNNYQTTSRIIEVLKKYKIPIVMFGLFETVAIGLWLLLDQIFYFFNFSYIGGFIALGLVLYLKKWKYARLVVQFSVGLYMLLYLGVFSRENMQLEGFWYYSFLGIFEAATIHYAVAKIFGPIFWGRGWCGYACWTAMILDLFPYKVPRAPRRKIGFVKYILFLTSFLFVLFLFLNKVENLEQVMFYSFIAGNILYYIVGIMLIFLLKDNRAFCKYVCPITVFLKPASYFSILRVKVETQTCVNCEKCKKECPMNVDMINNSRKRLNGTECILCFHCIDVCPTKSLHL